MSLLAGDLTTPQRVATWMANAPTLPSPIITQLIGSMTGLIYAKLNRGRIYSKIVTRTFDGVGNMQLVLPDYPVTSITSIYQGQCLIPPSVLVPQGTVQPLGTNPGYGYRYIPWNGGLPGSNAVVEFAGGFFRQGPQNIKVTYQAGYLVSNEVAVVPSTAPYQLTVLQQLGIWSRDNGMTYANGTALVPVTTITAAGQYIPPPDTTPGLYTFGPADAGQEVLVSYSFIPAPLEEACIQMIAERYAYRSRIGELSKSLGGQETVSFMRGNSRMPWGNKSALPPEIMDLINDYVDVVYPTIGAPL